jgi:hypothetical protein
MFQRHLPRLSGRALTLFAIVVVTLTIAPSLSAGSKKPNPAALQKAAGALAEEQAATTRQAEALLHRLASDEGFAKSFDAAVYKGDKAALTRLITEGGVTNKFTIDNIDKDLRITITIRCSGRGCSITITVRW